MVGTAKCPFTTAEEFADPENIFQVLKYLALSVYKQTLDKMFSKDQPVKVQVNENGVQLVRLAEIHMSYVGISICKNKEKSFECPNFVGHLRNLFALLSI